MNITQLRTELQTDPLALGYAPHIASSNDAALADIINEKKYTRIVSRIISARGVLSDYPGGPMAAAAVLDKLEAAASSVSALKWALNFLRGDGLDIGAASTQGVIDQLVAGGILTSAEGSNLKSLASVPAGRAEVLFGSAVSINDIASALRP